MELPLLPSGINLDGKSLVREDLDSMHDEAGDTHDDLSSPVSTRVEPDASEGFVGSDAGDLKPKVDINNIFQQILMGHMISRVLPSEKMNQAYSEFMPRSVFLPYDGNGPDHDSDDSKGKGKERAKPMGPSGIAELPPGLFDRRLEFRHAAMYQSPYAFPEKPELEYTEEIELGDDDMDDVLFSMHASRRNFFDALPTPYRVSQPEFIAGPSRITLDHLG